MHQPRGRPPHPDILTPAEWQVANLVRHGVPTRRIAALRGTSVDAVKFHVANILGKLGLPSRAALKAWDGVHHGSPISERSETMSTSGLGPIGQIAREVKDIRAAERWYKEVLRLPHLYTFGDLAFFACGDTRLFLTPPESGEPSAQSILYFRVDDIHAHHRDLAERGVRFEGAPHLIHRHADGTEEWMAFFHDIDGNMLALMEQAKPKA